MSRVVRADLDRSFERLTRMVAKINDGESVRWKLFEPSDAPPREPWAIQDQDGISIATLGYTRRDALSSLMSMCAILAVLLGA